MTFHSTRIVIRSILASALLIFGHHLLDTSVSALSSSPFVPIYEMNMEFAEALKWTSSIISLTLLWTIFSVFEDFDLVKSVSGNEVTEQGWLCIFGQTWIELLANTIALTGWTLCAPASSAVVSLLNAGANSRLGALPISYTVSFICVVALQAQLVFAIYSHLVDNGIKAIWNTSFWLGQTGHWTKRVRLDEDDEENFVSEKRRA